MGNVHKAAICWLVIIASCAIVFRLRVPAAVFHYCTSRHLVSGAHIGDSRGQVIRRLGDPEHIACTVSQFTRTNAYTPVPAWPVENEVLEYYDGMWKLYVYIDHRSRVSRVVLART